MFVASRLLRKPPVFRSLNRTSLTGVVHDVQSGYLGDDAVVQLTLSYHVMSPEAVFPAAPVAATTTAVAAPGGGGKGATAPSTAQQQQTPLVRRTNASTKYQIPVRCFGTSEHLAEVKSTLAEGYVVNVVGQLRTNIQSDSVSGGKKHAFPFIAVDVLRKTGSIQVLHGSRKKAAAQNFQKEVEAAFGQAAKKRSSTAAAAPAAAPAQTTAAAAVPVASK